ncbi:MAG TPA: hypothetical protein VIL65_05550 [Beijerinckiaceae bacterium]|jgi:hypothetical protein
MGRARLLIAALVLASGATAQESPRPRTAQASGHNHLDCYCRAQGRTFAVGETACLRMPQGGRMAVCEMALNVTSWGVTEQTCPES